MAFRALASRHIGGVNTTIRKRQPLSASKVPRRTQLGSVRTYASSEPQDKPSAEASYVEAPFVTPPQAEVPQGASTPRAIAPAVPPAVILVPAPSDPSTPLASEPPSASSKPLSAASSKPPPPAPSKPLPPVPSEPAPSKPAYASDQPPPAGTFEVSTEDVKASLVDSLYGTERGLSTSNELRAEINELITQLEARNPTPNPTEVMSKLDGSWRLVYTSSSALLAVLALGKLPLVTVGDFIQKIDSSFMTVENKVTLSGPLSRTALSTTASYEVRSPKRLELKLSGGQVATPTLTGDLDLPSSVTVLGQFIDLTQLKEAVTPLKEQAEGLITQLNQLMGQVPDLKVPIDNDEARTWQLTTYVDEDLRVSRGDGGSVFIYSRI